MKVYAKVVIDMRTSDVVESESFEYNGSVALCKGSKSGGGGGGSAGNVDYALWIKNRWLMLMDNATGDSLNDTLSQSAFDLVNTHVADSGNPYYNAQSLDVSASNPAQQAVTYTSGSLLDNLLEKYTPVETEVSNVDPQTNFGNYVDTAVNKASSAFPQDINYIDNLSNQIANAIQAAVDAIDSAPINQEVDAFEKRTRNKHLRTVSRFAAGMSDVNAVNSSAFTIGMAILEREYSDEVLQYRTKLNLSMYDTVVKDAIRSHLQSYIERYRIRDAFIAQATSEMIKILAAKENWQLMLSAQRTDVEQVRYAMLKEQTDRGVALDVSYAQWKLDTYQFAGNMMAALSGGTMGTVEQQPSDAAKVIGAGMSILSLQAGLASALLGFM